MQKNFDPKLHRYDSCQSALNGVNPFCKVASIIFAVIVLAYDISPVDLIPDAVPVLGWLDDIGATAIAAMNIFQAFAKNRNSPVLHVVKIIKWILVLIGVLMAITIVMLFLMGIVLIQE